MKCIICKRQLRRVSKYELCSNCQSIHLGRLIKIGIIKLEVLKEGVKSLSSQSD